MLITANEAKRNRMREAECGEGSVERNGEPMWKNRMEGVAERGERA
jgi:hypothetical protein